MIKRNLYKTKLKDIRSIIEGVFVLSFVRNFEFKAGQVVAIDLVPDGQARLYSIASGEQDEDVEILFDEKSDGKLTPFLSKLKPGDKIYVSDPFGTFKCGTKKAYWIAAGTGVAPFVSMARSGLGINKTMIQGARWDDNFYFAETFEELMSENYIRCCSQQEDTLYFKGRMTEWLKHQDKLPVDYHYYLCGSPEMVVEIRDILIAKGIAFKLIISETYF